MTIMKPALITALVAAASANAQVRESGSRHKPQGSGRDQGCNLQNRL